MLENYRKQLINNKTPYQEIGTDPVNELNKTLPSWIWYNIINIYGGVLYG